MIKFFKKYWLILAIIILGALLRFSGLLQNPISLFSDEIDMGYQAYSLLKTGCDYQGYCFPVQFHSFSDVQPPIPIYLIALCHFLGLPLDYSIRFVSALFGTLGIISTYLLVRQLESKKIFNLKLAGLENTAAFLLAIVPWHLTYSRIGFSMVTLYFFFSFGIFLFLKYISRNQDIYLFLGTLFLSLTPMVYNTAKLAIVFYPIVLLVLPGMFIRFRKNFKVKVSFVAIYIPLAILFLNGRTSARFDYISIFSDPTVGPEINNMRLIDSGPNPAVGTGTSTVSKFVHNKPLLYIDTLIKNIVSLTSNDFLFINGDPNERHSVVGWGMLYKSLIPALFLGIYYLIRFRHDRLIIFLGLLITIAVSTSAITREGASHASRSFMMILPLIILCGLGLSFLWQKNKITFVIFILILCAEFSLFLHDYWFHYRFSSEKSWSAGEKELITLVKKFIDRPVIISPRYENPLIFYLFYTNFDPKRFQGFVKSNTLYNSTKGDFNLDGNRIGDTNLYIASLVDYKNKVTKLLPNAVYFLTAFEITSEATNGIQFGSKDAIINLPSGKPLFYEIQ